MDTRTPTPSQAAKTVTAFLARHGLSIRHALALEVVARTRGFTDALEMHAATPEDENLDLFMQSQMPKDLPRPTTSLSSDNIGAIRKALMHVKGYSREEGSTVVLERFVAFLTNDSDSDNRPYLALRVEVHLDSDEQKGRFAPYATVTTLSGDNELLVPAPVPKEHETVMNLNIRLLIKAIRSEGVRLTEVYEETPAPVTAEVAQTETAEA